MSGMEHVDQGLEELQRTVRTLLKGWAWTGKLTFDGKGGGPEFATWVRDWFLPVQAPHLLRSASLSLAGNSRDLIAADAAYPCESPGSIPAGRALLHARQGASHLPALRALARAVEDGRTPGHLATVLGVAGSAFSIGHLPLLHASLFMEWRAALPGVPDAAFIQEAAPVFPLLGPLVRQSLPSPFSAVGPAVHQGRSARR